MDSKQKATFIEIEPGVKLHVRDWGSGKPILFIHGWPFSSEQFEYQFTQLPLHGYRCIGVDMRGSGKSDQPWSDCTYDTFADDIKKVIDALGLNDITLAGFSVGGPIVLHYIARHNAHKVSKLALFAPAAPSWTKRPDFPYGFDVSFVDDLIKQGYNDRPQLLTNFGNILFHQFVKPGIIDWLHAMGMEASPQTVIQTLVSLRDSDIRADLPKVKIPTLILHGKQDKICPFELGEYVHKNIPGSKLIPFEHSGHGLWYEERDKFNKELMNFVGK